MNKYSNYVLKIVNSEREACMESDLHANVDELLEIADKIQVYLPDCAIEIQRYDYEDEHYIGCDTVYLKTSEGVKKSC